MAFLRRVWASKGGRRALAISLVVLVLLVFLVLGRRDPSNPEEGGQASTTPTARNGTDLDRISEAAPEAASSGDVTLVVLGCDNRPVPNLEVGLGTRASSTDVLGEVVFEAVEYGSHSLSYSDGWIQPDGPTKVEDVTVSRPGHVIHVIACEDCSGPFRVAASDGSPVVDAELVTDLGSFRTDGDGRTGGVPRMCGPQTVGVFAGAEGRFGEIPVLIEDGDLMQIDLPGLRSAEVLLRGPGGERVPAVLKGGFDLHTVEELGDGHYRVAGPVQVLRLSVWAEGFTPLRRNLLLDGQRHVLTLEPRREVLVDGVCEPSGCPTAVGCDNETCAGQGPEYYCLCGAGPSRLRFDDTCPVDFRMVTVPRDVDEIAVDFRCGSGRVQGRWKGPQPCYSAVYGDARRSGECDPEGHFTVDGLQAGTYTLTVGQSTTEELWGGRGQPSWRGTRVVELDTAEQRDVGVIDPDEGCIEGRIEADFSLVGAMVSEALTSSVVRVARDGSFQLCDLPDDVALSLRLRVPGNGVYETTALTGSPLTWELEIGDGV